MNSCNLHHPDDCSLLHFEGVLSRARLEALGASLRDSLAADTTPGRIHDVFLVYIELAQNIRHYAADRGYAEQDIVAAISIIRRTDGRYVLCIGNTVELDDGRRLVARVDQLAPLDPLRLKQAYQVQLHLRSPRDRKLRAGLGLIDVARRASAPLQASLVESRNKPAFFCLSVTI